MRTVPRYDFNRMARNIVSRQRTLMLNSPMRRSSSSSNREADLQLDLNINSYPEKDQEAVRSMLGVVEAIIDVMERRVDEFRDVFSGKHAKVSYAEIRNEVEAMEYLTGVIVRTADSLVRMKKADGF